MNFLVLMENYNRYKELTEESANAAGTADKKYEAYMDSMEAATKTDSVYVSSGIRSALRRCGRRRKE